MTLIINYIMLVRAMIEYAILSLKFKHAWYVAIYASATMSSALAGIGLVHLYGAIGFVMFLPIAVLVCVGAAALVSIIDETYYTTQQQDNQP